MLESVYDDEIAPLMAQVIAVCKQHGLPVFASFQLNDGAAEIARKGDEDMNSPYTVNPWGEALRVIVVWALCIAAALAIVVLLASCAPATPTNARVAAPSHQTEALALLDLVEPAAVSITWMDGDCLRGTDQPGCTVGLALPGCDLYVLRRFSLRASALVHELLHCRAELLTGDPDSDHAGARWAQMPEHQAQLWEWEKCIVWDCGDR